MRYNETVMLKNGKPCLIRHGEAEDAQAVYDVFQLTHGETDFLLSYPDENSLNVEQERQFLLTKAEDPREVELCAVVDGNIVGTAGIAAVGHKDKVKHRAELGISIARAYWGQGIGRALIEACIACAVHAGFVQLELDVVAENQAATHLYQSIGFVEFGRNPKGFCSRASGWQETVLMRLDLTE